MEKQQPSAPDFSALHSLGLDLEIGVPLSQLGSFQLGGPAAALIRCREPGDLSKIRKLCHEEGVHALLLGEGSNLLFSDHGWHGLLIRYADGNPLPQPASPGWRFAASANLQAVVDWATREGWAGLEAFHGIPGTLGGAVVGNAGAWGVQMEQVLLEIHGVDTIGNPQIRSVADCGFSYRNSLLKTDDFWVTEVVIELTEADPVLLESERKRILDLRAARHPDWKREPCIGSYFKNLEPSSAAERRQAAGFFLEQAGAKEMKVGGAGVFRGHANILVKQGTDCRADDVAALARQMQAAVLATHGIQLEREVRYLGEIAGEHSGMGFY